MQCEKCKTVVRGRPHPTGKCRKCRGLPPVKQYPKKK